MSEKNRGEFHAPPDWLAPARRANPAGDDAELELTPVVVRAGGASFHHHNTFHGSGPNTAATRAPARADLAPPARRHPVLPTRST